jgi:hypothetical protein
VSVYGLGRFPVTLYKEQWLKLLAMADDIRRSLSWLPRLNFASNCAAADCDAVSLFPSR